MKKSTTHPSVCFFVLILLGIWLLSAPGTFNFQSPLMVYNDLICGALFIIFGLALRRRPTSFLLWTVAGLGVWLQCAPLLFWAPSPAAYLNNILIGSIAITVSILLFPMPHQVPDEEPTIPPGWSYNPSSWPQRIPIAFFAFICWMIAKYLAAKQLGYIDTVWDPFFDPGTDAVLSSSVSQLFPVSDAGLGALAYTLEFFFTCQGGKARWRTSPWGVCVFGILAVPVSLVSAILIILQPLVVGTWCTLCLVTAICMLIPIPLAVDEVIASYQYLKRSREKPFLHLLFFGGKDPQAKVDKNPVTLLDPWGKILKTSLLGVSFPWNFSVSILLGMALMALPSFIEVDPLLFDLDPIIGAFIVMSSVVAYSEYLRFFRYCNISLGLLLCMGAFFVPSFRFLHIVFGLVIILLSLRKGKSYHAHHFV